MTNERLCTLAQQGDTQAQEQLVQNNLGYIRKTANELYISVGLGNSELGIDHDDLIQEGLTAKLVQMPEDVRGKFRGTLTRIVNEGATGLICLIL